MKTDKDYVSGFVNITKEMLIPFSVLLQETTRKELERAKFLNKEYKKLMRQLKKDARR